MILVLILIILFWLMPMDRTEEPPTTHPSPTGSASPSPTFSQSPTPTPTPRASATPEGKPGTRSTADCSKAPGSKSTRGVHSTTITWVNVTSTTIKVYWIDYDGERVYYESIATGKTFVQRTWESHPWIVLDSTGACRGFAVAGSEPSTYHVR